MATKFVDLLYKLPAFAQQGDHWELESDEAERLGKAVSDCVDTLDDKRVAAVSKWLDKLYPWFTLGYVGIPLTYDRIQKTRHLYALQRHQEDARRRGVRPIEILREPRADQAAPITSDPGATVPVTEGLIQPTESVSVFGRGATGQAAISPDGAGRDASGENVGGIAGFPA